VADYMLFQHGGTGAVSNMCVWSEGVPSLLPRTELVALVQDDSSGAVQAASMFGPEGAIVAPWETVEAIVGDMLVPLDLYPARYKVEHFPTPAQRDRVKQTLATTSWPAGIPNIMQVFAAGPTTSESHRRPSLADLLAYGRSTPPGQIN
jgi:hypothetical protein